MHGFWASALLTSGVSASSELSPTFSHVRSSFNVACKCQSSDRHLIVTMLSCCLSSFCYYQSLVFVSLILCVNHLFYTCSITVAHCFREK